MGELIIEQEGIDLRGFNLGMSEKEFKKAFNNYRLTLDDIYLELKSKISDGYKIGVNKSPIFHIQAKRIRRYRI